MHLVKFRFSSPGSLLFYLEFGNFLGSIFHNLRFFSLGGQIPQSIEVTIQQHLSDVFILPSPKVPNWLVCFQGVSKGLVAKRLLSIMQENEMSPDFVLCIGDDRSDEDMFEVITTSMAGPSIAENAEVFACTVGRKPSKAKYYLDDTAEIVRLMQGLASVSEQTVTV
jgi:hypothetical protein